MRSPFLRSRLVTLGALTLAYGLLAGCRSPEPVSEQIVGSTMGTTYSVQLPTLPDGLTVDTLLPQIEAELATINAQMSTYMDDSELSRFNAAPAGDWFPVSKELAEVVLAGIAMSDRTGGAFDVTVGPLVNLWGFGPAGRRGSPPSSEELQAAQAHVGYERLQARTDPPALRKEVDALYVDLSAIAKGYAVDRLAELLEDRGVTTYFVDIGGEVRTHGLKPDGSAWTLGIEEPRADGRALARAVRMPDGAMATSGDYRNYFEVNGKRYAHVLDPRTARPVEHGLASVSVFAASCIEADGLATALLVMGADEAFSFAEGADLPVLLIERRDGELVQRATSRFDALLESPS